MVRAIIFIHLLLLLSTLGIAQNYITIDTDKISLSHDKLNTEVLQNYIDSIHNIGGGTITFPDYSYYTGTLVLKSNVTLHFEEGAILIGSPDLKDYKKATSYYGLIIANGAENICLSGKGEINGNGQSLAYKLDSLYYVGEIDSINYNHTDKRPRWNIRPNLIELYNCKNIIIKDLKFTNSACWVQKIDKCHKVEISDIKIESDSYWNNDGIDVMDSKNVTIKGCEINASDDGICIKSNFKNQQEGPIMCDSIWIEDCIIRSSASAVKIGTNIFGGAKNIWIKNIEVKDTYRSALTIQSVDGGIVENIHVNGIKATNTGNALFIRLGNRTRNRGENPKPGFLRNIHIRDLDVEIASDRPDKDYIIKGPALPYFHNIMPSSIVGIPGAYIEDIHLENITIKHPGKGNYSYSNFPTYKAKSIPEAIGDYPEFSMFGEIPAWGLYLRHVKGLHIKNVELHAKNIDDRPAILYENVKSVYRPDFTIKSVIDIPQFYEVK